MAAELSKREGVRVELTRGGLGELRVSVDGRDVYIGSRLLYPRPSTVLLAIERAGV